MRLSGLLLTFLAFAVAAGGAILGARAAVAVAEDRSVVAVRDALAGEGLVFARVLGDGLQIVLEGEAPSEAQRFRAMSVAGGQVDASRVIDNLSVMEREGLAPPAFAVEILRNDAGVSLIGLVPANTDRERMADRIAEAAPDKPITDLMETADHPIPPGWAPAMIFALEALERLQRAKISVSAGEVSVVAMAESATDQRRIESELARLRPDGLSVAVDITAPRPVISPFIVRFVSDADGARFEACAAGSAESEAIITEAAVAAGLDGRVSCRVGLGMPSANWSEAVALSIGAVAELGGGTVTLTDADVSLVAPADTPEAVFERVAGELGNALPPLFALEAVLAVEPDAEAVATVPEFTATRSPEGLVQLRGPVADTLMNTTAETYARAQFDGADISMGTRVREGLPAGWSVRVLAGIAALGELESGSVIVRPDTVRVSGLTGNPDASTKIAQLLVEKLGQDADFSVDVTYEERLDPIAALPTPEECLQQIGTVTRNRKITFDPGSADIAGAAQVVMDDIAEILRRCPDLRVEVAGYTDSQGREEMNLRLSQDRADAVLRGLRERRVPVSSFSAVGYGEADPIADNETEEGREANRRIEFRLVGNEVTDAFADTGGEAAAVGEDGTDEQN